MSPKTTSDAIKILKRHWREIQNWQPWLRKSADDFGLPKGFGRIVRKPVYHKRNWLNWSEALSQQSPVLKAANMNGYPLVPCLRFH